MKKNSAGAKETLKRILIEKSYLRDGHYTLSSGETSNVFFDVKMTSLDPLGANLAAELMLEKLEGHDITAIGGLALGACPIISALCVKSHDHENSFSFFYVRKEKKSHGTGKDIEGATLKKQDKVAIVDDVATKGGSILEAIRHVNLIGCEIVKILVIVDREQGAGEALAKEGYTLESIFTRSELEK
ncbi:MAG: orotate phosphoribosyltransferase [Pseudomonadota bacterium]|nr:orotate phosphoribosyltransferase [Pseudomonadota bacterium]